MAEVIHGNASGESLSASADRTQVYGLAGNDTLTSNGRSNVLLVGGSGDDTLIVTGNNGTIASGNATLAGGEGADTFVFNYSTTSSGAVTAVIQDFDPAEDKIVINYTGTGSASIASATSNDNNSVIIGSGTAGTSTVNTVDLIWRDTVNSGYFRVTLKSARDNDYFDGTGTATLDDRLFEILELTNQERENRNRSPLTMSDGLTKAASIRVNEIYNNGSGSAYISHTRPDGTDYDTVFEEVDKAYGGRQTPAENLETGGDLSLPEDAMASWMGSASHSINVVNTNFQKLGVGYIYEDSSDYEYYYEQLFADVQTSPTLTVISANDMAAAGYTIGGSEDTTVPTNPVTLTAGDDVYANSVVGAGATVLALAGNDSISNTYASVSIDGSTDNDTIVNSGNISTINAGGGDDNITNTGTRVSISGGDGADNISNGNSSVTINANDGNNYISNTASNVTVSAGTGSDTVLNTSGGNSVSISTGAGDDSITSGGSSVTITANMGNDVISLGSAATNNVINYTSGDGSDTVSGFNTTSTLQIGDGTGTYASVIHFA